MVKQKMEDAVGVVWRVITQDCKGGKALNTLINMFCAAVLLWGAPKAWDLYWDLRGDVAEVKEIATQFNGKQAALLEQHEHRLNTLETDVASHKDRDDARFDRLNDRMTLRGLK